MSPDLEQVFSCHDADEAMVFGRDDGHAAHIELAHAVGKGAHEFHLEGLGRVGPAWQDMLKMLGK